VTKQTEREEKFEENLVSSLSGVVTAWKSVEEKIEKYRENNYVVKPLLKQSIQQARDAFQNTLDMVDDGQSPDTMKTERDTRVTPTVIERPYTVKKRFKKTAIQHANMEVEIQKLALDIVKEGLTIFNVSPSTGLSSWVQQNLKRQTNEHWTCIEDSMDLCSKIRTMTTSTGAQAYHLVIQNEEGTIATTELKNHVVISTPQTALLLCQCGDTQMYKAPSGIKKQFVVKYAHMDERMVDYAEKCVKHAAKHHLKDGEFSIAQFINEKFNKKFEGTSWSCVVGSDLGDAHVCNGDKPLVYCKYSNIEVLLWETD